jgi:hypothetical protein
MQGWLSLSHTGTGEGTLRLLPSLKLTTAYLMLRPFFVINEEFDDMVPTFPGATPGETQLFPTKELHPHLNLDRMMVGIPPVRPGDYVFWHCDLIHEVDKFHPGTRDSSVAYNACVPLCNYNLQSLVHLHKSFLEVSRPLDFFSECPSSEQEKDHEDHGAKMENLLSCEGRRAMGFERFDVDEEGLTEGQKEIRRAANVALGFV